MLSVRCRDEDRGLGKNRPTGLGFVGLHEMEENDLEEGEACSYRDEDSDHNPDVDVDLSYIDEKIQNVLGHFQKDFEGGVSAENLGATFGGYGSFLQSPRSPPAVSHPGSSVRIQPPGMKIGGDQSFASHGVRQSITHQPMASVPPTSTPLQVSAQLTTSATSMDVSVVKHVPTHAIVYSAGECSPKGDAVLKPPSCNAKKSLKVRLKVPSCPPTKNNAEIYSGLGLDISPSSSLEESSGFSGGLPLEDHDSPAESPTTILQVMTSSPTPGGFLSPLSDSLLQLIAKGNLFRRDSKSGSGQKKDFTVQKVKTRSVAESPGNPIEINHLDAAVDKGITTLVKKEINIDAPDGLTSKLSLPAEVKEKRKTTKTVGKLGKPGEVCNMTALIEEKCSPYVVKKEMVVDTPASKELVLESVEPSSLGKKDNSLGKMDIRGAGYVRKSSYKILDLLNEDEDTFTPESVLVSDYVNVEMKEITRTPLLNKFDMAGKDSVSMKAWVTLKANSADKPWFHQEFLDKDNRECSADPNGKIDAKYDASEDIVRRKKKTNESSKHKIVERKLTSDNGDKVEQEVNAHLSSGKPRLKDDESARKSTPGSSETKSMSSASHKHKIKGPRLDVLEAQPDLMRLQESNRNANKDYCIDPTGHVKTEHAKGSLPLDSSNNSAMINNIKDTTISSSGHNEIEPFGPAGRSVEILESKTSQNASPYGEGVTIATMSTNGLAPETTDVTTSVLITEEWVCCDKCQKWRLLPYGLQRPKENEKWVCRMQSWLPGLNKCNVSKEEGIKAFYALYQIEDHQNRFHRQKMQNSGDAPLTGGQNLHSNLLLSGSVSGAGRKHLQEARNDPNFIVAASHPNSTKENLTSLVKKESLNDVNHHPLDPNPLDNDGLLHVGKAPGRGKEKRKHKHQGKLKSLGSYPDGGEPIGQDLYSKSKGKRELLQSNHGGIKKVKRDKNELMGRTSNGTILDRQNALKQSDHSSSSKDSKCDDLENDINLGKMVKSHNQVSLNAEHKLKPGNLGLGKLVKDEISTKKRKIDELQELPETGESALHKWHCSDLTAPKSIVDESEHRKEKKSKSSKFGGRESSTSITKMDKKGGAVRVVPYSGGELVMDEANEESCGMHEKEQNVRTLMGNSVSRRISEPSNPLKVDAGCNHSATATSSSSKVSGSRKTKFNVFEMKGSPVESVSSSPLRTTNRVKVMPRNNCLEDDLVNTRHGTGSNLGRHSDGEVDGARKDKSSSAIQHSVQDDDMDNKSSIDAHRKKYDQDIDRERFNPLIAPNSHGATDSRFSVEYGNNHGTDDTEWKSQIVSGLKIKQNGMKIKNYDKGDVSVHVKSVKGMPSLSKNKQWTNKLEPGKGKSKVHDSYDKNLAEFCPTKNEQDAGDQSSSHQAERLTLHSEGGTKLDKDIENDVETYVKCSGRKGSDVQSITKNPDKLDTQDSAFAKQKIRSVVGKSEAVHRASVYSNPQEPLAGFEGKFFNQNLSSKANQTVLVSGRENIVSLSSSGSKKQAQMAAFSPHIEEVDVPNSAASKLSKQSRQHDDTNVAVNGGLRHFAANGIVNKEPDAIRNILKEATNVKHSADHLRNDGLELESIGLYFSAALKFLHAASLLEPNDGEVAKQGDNSSMKVYVDTAKLCRFCAHMYEKHKDMAAAALAYKCMEVAFMRVIFLKHHYANCVLQELQALAPNVIGESPSSSASDVDNLNNSWMPERLRQVQGVSSPQIPTNIVISGSSRRSFDWLLNLANDVNLAMDAFRKSHNAFAAATGNLENVQYRPEAISLVWGVIEFNFHDVEELVRRVRSSLEEISH